MAVRSPESSQDISILLEEYRVLYELVQLRLAALDRRIPLVGTVLALLGAGVPLVPVASAALLLWATPIAMVWLVRTTIAHACSFEDALRRIEQIENQVNELAGKQLLLFQSSHPSKGTAVGGRTSAEAVATVSSIASLFLLAAVLLAREVLQDEPDHLVTLVAAIGLSAIYLAGMLLRWRRYRYQQRS